MPDGRILIAFATYNELENLPALVDEVQSTLDCDVLVVDDNSPDGTGTWCEERLKSDSRFHHVGREGKLGLGTAIVAALKFALSNGYDWVITMDADYSHHPKYLPSIQEKIDADEHDMVIGSRYVPGGGVSGWPLKRQLMSKAVNFYARTCLRMSVHDCSGDFRAYRVSQLESIDFDNVRAKGYAFVEELLWLVKRTDARITEVPIVFEDRRYGMSKINGYEARMAVWIIFRLGLKTWFGL